MFSNLRFLIVFYSQHVNRLLYVTVAYKSLWADFFVIDVFSGKDDVYVRSQVSCLPLQKTPTETGDGQLMIQLHVQHRYSIVII